MNHRETIALENDCYRLEMDSEHGAIHRIYDRIACLELIAEPRLAANFQVLLPLRDMQANTLLGKEQRLTAFEQTAQGVTLYWKGPLENPQGAFDLDVAMHIELAGQAISFRLDVHNRTPFQVAEVWYPLLGGITGIGERKDTEAMIPFMGESCYPDLFQNFRGMVELGTPVPEYFFPYSTSMPMPWVDLYNRRLERGVYFSCHDTVPRFGALRFQMQPGIAHGRLDTWPRSEELDKNIPAGITANWVNFPYTQPGETFEGPPVVVQCHEGDWHEGARIYRQWFTSHFPLPDPKGSWLRQEMAFQNTMFLLPEGNVQRIFHDIPGWAQDALDYGVKSVLISGWDRGGHDNQYPYYEPDARLGTWEDLAAAVRECHQMGMRVFFFANFQPVDPTTDWYREELHRYRSMDPWGCSTPMGWGMGTLGARMGFTKHPMVKASPAFSEFRAIIIRQMVQLARIGADGLQIDKLNSVGMDFNPTLSESPDRASCEGILKGLDELLSACRAVNPEFCVSVESAWDRTLQYSDVAWVWHPTWVIDHAPAYKFTFPEWLPAIAITQPYDYNVVNTAVRFGYQLLIGPAHYTASMQDGPMRPLSTYIREILRMREELKDTIFMGEFLDTLETHVQGHERIRFSTHRNPRTGKRACVLVNFGETPHRASVSFAGNLAGTARIHRPFEKVRSRKFPVTLTIPAERLAIVLEE
ncbi:MAG: DUF6259 domain-containing protein [Candidatus Latescibacterota bacterium]